MKVLFASAECAPFFKTGGLGDVASALPKALAKEDMDIRVVLPYFAHFMATYQADMEDLGYFYVDVGWRHQYCGVKKLEKDGIVYYFLDNLYYFGRDAVYGYDDDGERFAFFQLALIEMMEKITFIPDTIHVNDYHTAMVPFLLKEKYQWIQAYSHIRTVLTIHNIEFQGQFSPSVLSDLFGVGMQAYQDGRVRFDDGVNFLKAGILCADRVTTVSPSYAEEIQTEAFGCGLDGILRMESWKLSGILNGIDYVTNNPETDTLIPHPFSIDDLTGKAKDKAALQKTMGLPINPEKPLIAVVSRLTHQKGFQLVMDEMAHLLQFDIQLIVLGTGNPDFEAGFRYFSQTHPDKCAVSISFDIRLAQQFYAGADLFLMPSAFEPCGLSQMMAMRYGTLPIVHEIGGLKDTVRPYNPIEKTGTGFGFNQFSSFYMMEAIKLAIRVYQEEPTVWRQLINQAMTTDFSWKHSSKIYQELYRTLQ